MIAPTPIIAARKNGNVQRVIDLHSKGMSPGRIAKHLGVEIKTVRSYLKIYCDTDGKDDSDDTPKCRCGLRLFGNEEVPGQCDRCLPTSAVGFLGRRGESIAVAITGRFHG